MAKLNLVASNPDPTNPNLLLFEFIKQTKDGKYTEEKPAVKEEDIRLDVTELYESPECIYLGIA